MCRSLRTTLSILLPAQAQELSKAHAHPEGREVSTRAVWNCFSDLRLRLAAGWSLYPKTIRKWTGKAKGEYLLDFMLMDAMFGPAHRLRIRTGQNKECRLGAGPVERRQVRCKTPVF